VGKMEVAALVFIGLLMTGTSFYSLTHLHSARLEVEALKAERQELLKNSEAQKDEILAAQKEKADLIVVLMGIAAENYQLRNENIGLSGQIERLGHQVDQMKRYNGLREFGSFEELAAWLYENPVSTRPRIPGEYVCSDFARDLVLDAISQGWLMGLSRIANERHQKAFTIIGKDIYEIEAETDGIKWVGKVY